MGQVCVSTGRLLPFSRFNKLDIKVLLDGPVRNSIYKDMYNDRINLYTYVCLFFNLLTCFPPPLNAA